MKFELITVWRSDSEVIFNKYPKLRELKNIQVENEEIYIEINNPEQLKEISTKCKMQPLIVDFELNQITIYDDCIE